MCVWGSGATAATARIHRQCLEGEWELVACATRAAVGDGTLGWIVKALGCTGAEGLILTRENLDDLERYLPEMWQTIRACLEERHVVIVAV
jgi:hypothetical protein